MVHCCVYAYLVLSNKRVFHMQLDSEILEAIFTNKANDLNTLTQRSRVLLIFLRHFGCPFCREALDDLSAVKAQLKKQGIKLVFVHLAEEMYADVYLAEHGLADEEHISDPDMSLYEYFGLQKGGFRELYGLKVWSRVVHAIHQPTVNQHTGNWRQMPGLFLLHQGRVVNSFVHRSAADRPDYLAFCKIQPSPHTALPS